MEEVYTRSQVCAAGSGAAAGVEVGAVTATAPGRGSAIAGGPKPVSWGVPSDVRLTFISRCYASCSRWSHPKSAYSGPTSRAA